MKLGNRADRMKRHHRRGKSVALNLVSLMDIFTILVFFLLVNSGEMETLPNAKDLQMPESIAEQKPRENVVVMITENDILVQGEVVATVAIVESSSRLVIRPLKAQLVRLADRRVVDSDDEDAGEVTIMGDKEIPYSLLKKVMATCTDANYSRISLAVIQKAPEEVTS